MARDSWSPSDPEPLSYHQPSHPDVHEPTNGVHWRQPLLPPEECDHDREHEHVIDPADGESVVQHQCLDCAEVLRTESLDEDSQS